MIDGAACLARFAVATIAVLTPRVALSAELRPLQALIDEAQPGAVVAVPPGTYEGGAKITKALTLRMKGAVVRGSADGKGVVSIDAGGEHVVIEDLTATDAFDCSSGNCAGVKIEGRDFDVTLRRAHIANQIMGVLTSNRGGTLVIEDSLIEEEGHPDSALSHLVYAGVIDRLVVRNSTLRRSRYLGHLLKSRARETVVERSLLLGLDGAHSRSIDLPCGGALSVRDSVIQHGAFSDNADLFSVGTEPKICWTVRPGDVVLENNWIVSDRRPASDDPEKTPEPNTLFSWWAQGANRLRASGNRIVNIERWQGEESWIVPDLARDNAIFAGRSAAGLGPEEIPPLPAQ